MVGAIQKNNFSDICLTSYSSRLSISFKRGKMTNNEEETSVNFEKKSNTIYYSSGRYIDFMRLSNQSSKEVRKWMESKLNTLHNTKTWITGIKRV